MSRLARYYGIARPKANKKWEMTNMSLIQLFKHVVVVPKPMCHIIGHEMFLALVMEYIRI